MLVGEWFSGDGPNAAHINVMLGERDGPFGSVWATALATPTAGHAPFVVIAKPGLPVQPFTLFVNKATIAGDAHARLTWGAAQAGVATGVITAVETGVIDTPTQHLLIAAVWVDPAATDEQVVFANNREATFEALTAAVEGLPHVYDVIAAKDEVSNAFFPTVTPRGRKGGATR